MIFIPDSSDGVDGTSLKMAKVVPGDAPAPLPVHFANHGLAVSEANRGLAEVGHNSPERGAVDLVCTAERHSTISSSSKGCRVVFFIGHWPSRNGRGSMHRLHLCVSCGSLLAKDVQGCSTRKYAGWMLALSMQRILRPCSPRYFVESSIQHCSAVLRLHEGHDGVHEGP